MESCTKQGLQWVGPLRGPEYEQVFFFFFFLYPSMMYEEYIYNRYLLLSRIIVLNEQLIFFLN